MMLGGQVGQQDRLFYEFNLEDRVASDHLLRRLDTVLDLNWLRTELSPFYSHTGRPSVDPELMIRMLLVGYCYSIPSERRLCQEVDFILAHRWFCRIGLENGVPDHSTFSVNRHDRFRDSDVLRTVFENVLRRCMEASMTGRGPRRSGTIFGLAGLKRLPPSKLPQQPVDILPLQHRALEVPGAAAEFFVDFSGPAHFNLAGDFHRAVVHLFPEFGNP